MHSQPVVQQYLGQALRKRIYYRSGKYGAAARARRWTVHRGCRHCRLVYKLNRH